MELIQEEAFFAPPHFLEDRGPITRCLGACCLREASAAHPLIVSNVPASWAFFYHALEAAGRSGTGEIEVHHIVSLLHEQAESYFTSILNTWHAVLPAAFLPGVRYRADRFAALCDEDLPKRYAFPYYIKGSDWCLLLNASGSSAFFLQSADTNHYFKHLEAHHQAFSVPFVFTAASAAEALALLAPEAGKPVFILSHQPCLMPFLGRDFADRHLHPECFRSELTAASCEPQSPAERFSRCLEQIQNAAFSCVFTEAGLRRFAADGRLDLLPEIYVRPCAPEERRRLLQALSAALRKDLPACRCRILNPDMFSFAGNFHILAGGNLVAAAGFSEGGRSDYRTAVVRDRPMAEAFCRYLSFLLDSYLCYSREETLRKLQSAMELIP